MTDHPLIIVEPVVFDGVAYLVEELIYRAGYTGLVQGTVVNLNGTLYVLDKLHFLLDTGPTAWSLRKCPK